jgi:plastocyanin
VQLAATPYNALGEVLSGLDRVTFVAADSGDSTVTVDSTGLVTARYTTRNLNSATHIIAKLRSGNVTLADTAVIQVTATPPAAALATFTLQPSVGQGTSCNYNAVGTPFVENCGTLVVNAKDSLGTILSSASKHTLVIAYRTLNPLIATINESGTIKELDTGRVTFTASTWAYGVAMQDSLRYVISWPRYNTVRIKRITPVNSLTPVLVFDPMATIIAAGGTVTWNNLYAQSTDVVFDDPAAVDSGCLFLLCGAGTFRASGVGNIPPFYTDPTFADTSVFAGGFVSRSFPVAGTYHYHSRLFPSSSGVIYVKEGVTP